MARSRDLRRGFVLNPLGIPIPVQPAPGQPMPGIHRTRPLEDIEGERAEIDDIRGAAKAIRATTLKKLTDKILDEAASDARFA